MRKIRVLVTGVGGFSHGSSIVKALLHSSLPLEIIGTDMSPRLISASPLKKTAVVPPANSPYYIDKIKSLLKLYSIDCIFSGSEEELIKICNYRQELESSKTKVFLNNKDTIFLCKNKLLCSEKLRSLGFYAPKTILLNKINDARKVDFLPAVIKPYLNTGSSTNVFVAVNRNELKFFTAYLLTKGTEIIAQEYLPYRDNEYTVGVTSMLDKPKAVSSIALKKFMEGPTKYVRNKSFVLSSGISQGEFRWFKEVCRVCEDIAEKIGSTGPLNIQLRLVNGKVRPFEINPRFSGTTSSRALTGYNEPEFYIRKYLLNDPRAADSLKIKRKGYVVKVYEERYVEYK